jgi:hypothetical protein
MDFPVSMVGDTPIVEADPLGLNGEVHVIHYVSEESVAAG